MIIAHLNRKKFEQYEITVENQNLLKEALWIDLISPSKEDEALVETCLNLDIPTREEMVEIELSSRLYKEDDTLFMTATMIAHSDSPEPKLDAIAFVLTKRQLITVRYIEPKSFILFNSQLQKRHTTHLNATTLLVDLLDVNVDRLADILELLGHRLDESSKEIFKTQDDNEVKPDYKEFMQKIGTNGDLDTKTRESLLTFQRLVAFFLQSIGPNADKDTQLRLTSISKDIAALSDHANFVANKVTFLLSATLGMVNIEQNNIIKIVSVAAVIFLPPTLIASIYGMNFHVIPELSWKYGYVFSVILMLLAAWLPYKYFKRRKWL